MKEVEKVRGSTQQDSISGQRHFSEPECAKATLFPFFLSTRDFFALLTCDVN